MSAEPSSVAPAAPAPEAAATPSPSPAPAATPAASPHHIVIVGGSFAGVEFAMHIDKLLKGSLKLTIIEPKHGIFLNPASPRAVVDPELAALQFLPFDTICPKTRAAGRFTLIHAKATSIGKESVTLDNGDTIPFDTCVIATGAKYHHPAKTEYPTAEPWVKEMTEVAEKLKEAKSVVVVGGGTFGVELSSEIKSAHPSHSVTLIHSHPALVGTGGFLPKSSASLLKKLQALGVAVRLGERVELPQDEEWVKKGYVFKSIELKTDKKDAEPVKADAVFLCTGSGKPNSEAAKAGLGDGVVNEKGQLKVTPTLQLATHQHIFAIGDVNDMAGDKTIMAARFQGAHLAKQFAGVFKKDKTASSKPDWTKATLVPYKNDFVGFFVTVGRKTGVVQLFGINVPGIIKMKTKDLMLGFNYGYYGAKKPTYPAKK